MTNPQVSIIILSYNTKELLRECLRSIYLKVKSVSFEVIVVDNASVDKSILMVKKEFPQVRAIQNKENEGFGRGINTGEKYAKGEYLLFLNSDAEILSDDLSGMITAYTSEPKVGVMGGKVKKYNGDTQVSTRSFYTPIRIGLFLLGGEKFVSHKKKDVISKVDWIEGSFFLIKKALFEKVGRFDKHIFMYVEDMELCFRVKKQGYSVLYYPFMQIKHMGQGSSNREFAIVNIYKGFLYFYKKHKSRLAYFLVKFMLVGKAIGSICIGYILRKKHLTQTYKKALQYTV